MNRYVAQDDLIAYLYREISDEECRCVEVACLADSELDALKNDFSEIKRLLDELIIEPAESCIVNVLDYSKSLSLKSRNRKNLLQ